MITNIKREMSLVSFSFQVFITWGTNDEVVNTAATNPISVIPSNCMVHIITYALGLMTIKKAAEWAALFTFFGFPRTLAGHDSGVNSKSWEYEQLEYYQDNKDESADNDIIHFFASALPSFLGATFS